MQKNPSSRIFLFTLIFVSFVAIASGANWWSVSGITLFDSASFAKNTPNSCQPGLGGQLFSDGGAFTVKILPAGGSFVSGIYLYSPQNQFIGNSNSPGVIAYSGPYAVGSELIFGINVAISGQTFMMGPGSRNPDGLVHASVQCGVNGIVTVGFEDQLGGGDNDFNDVIIEVEPVPTIYQDTTITLSDNVTIIPSPSPMIASRANVSIDTSFKGEVEADPATGVVRVTNAHPAGVYPTTVKAFNGSGVLTGLTSFNLTVNDAISCGLGTFATATNYGIGAFATGPQIAVVGDFNKDGNQDVATTANTNRVSVLLGNGSGGLGTGTVFSGLDGSALDLTVGDLNNDGNQDLAVATNAGTIRLLLGDGAGGFTLTATSSVGDTPQSLRIGDFNGDGKQDIITANGTISTSSLSIFMGNGDGTFATAVSFDPVGGLAKSIVVADFNGDGKHDIATANPGLSTISVMLGNGSGGFGSPSNVSLSSSPSSIMAADFNGDDIHDIVTANSSSSNISILIGTGSGSFSSPVNYATGSTPNSVAAGDFNGDGALDILTANLGVGWNNVSVLNGNGLGSFGVATNFGVGTLPRSAVVGDFNGDGRQDIAAANGNSNNISILLRTCPATPTNTPTNTATPTATATETFTPTPTDTPTNTATNTPTSTATVTNTSTFTPTPSASPSCYPTPSGMVSFYKAENSANDQTGLNNGTLVNAATFGSGLVGQAFSFNGGSSAVTIPDSPSLALTTSLTLSAWVNAATLPGGIEKYIVFRGDDRFALDPYSLAITSSGHIRFQITAAGGGTATLLATIGSGNWYHVTGTLNDTTGAMKIYINGVEAASTTTSIRPFGALDPIQSPGVAIGNLQNGFSQGFHGLIDEVAIFDRDLSASEVALIYNAGSIGECFTPTPTATETFTPTATNTTTDTPTSTATDTPTATATETFTPTATNTATDTPTNTPTPMETPSISGTVTYGNPASPTTKFISNATVSGTGSPNVFTTTAAPGGTAGQYSLTGFGSGNYSVGVSKTTGQNGIASADAARIAQHVSGISLITSPRQLIAADVTNNGAISSTDAAQIARFVAALGPPIGLTNQWRFFVPSVTEPTFPIGVSPTTRGYTDPIGNPTGQDFIGILIGEVTGNWNPTAARTVNSEQGTVDSASNAKCRMPNAECGEFVTVELPSFVGEVDKEIIVPVNVQGIADKNVISYEFDLRYDPSVMHPMADVVDVKDTISRGLVVVTNATVPGLLRVVVYGAYPIDSDGVLLNLRFAAVGGVLSISDLKFENLMFNEGESRVVVTDGRIELTGF